jgi:3-isopropylmalate/(R)-2-methylmalate dehydratase large subunit
MSQPATIRRTPGKRVLYLTKDPELIRKQLQHELELRWGEVKAEDLLDDINTDVMTPAWVCFDWKPEEIAREAYAGLIVQGERVFPRDALRNGNFEIIVSGKRKGTGSSRETAAQAEKYCGIRIAIAESFAPIHARNHLNLGTLLGGYDLLARLERGEEILLEEFLKGHDPITQQVIVWGGLFPYTRALSEGRVKPPARLTGKRPMTMAEKILARHLVDPSETPFVKPGDAVVVRVDTGYSHEFTTAQVHAFLEEEFGPNYKIRDPARFAVFEDHLIYADEVERMRPFLPKIENLRRMQRQFQRHTGVRDYSAREGVSPGICHEVARVEMVEPGDFVQATDSHTCMGGANNALAWGVGATEYAALLHSGFTMVEVPESIRFELVGRLRENVTAKDLMLYLLLHCARPGLTLNRVMEFTGPGVTTLSMDERATLANMATECSARGGIFPADEVTFEWLVRRRGEAGLERWRERAVEPDPDAEYAGGIHVIDLSLIEPMVAHPGDTDRGIPSDPTNGLRVAEIGEVRIDIAYAGSCTAGKMEDLDFYHRVVKEALEAGWRVAPGVQFIIQCGSLEVEEYARSKGYLEDFARAGVRMIRPGCGACIGCGPGVSERPDQVTVSAINRNYRGRSGPGKLWLASPLTVAASAFFGKITAYEPGMFVRQPAVSPGGRV